MQRTQKFVKNYNFLCIQIFILISDVIVTLARAAVAELRKILKILHISFGFLNKLYYRKLDKVVVLDDKRYSFIYLEH